MSRKGWLLAVLATALMLAGCGGSSGDDHELTGATVQVKSTPDVKRSRAELYCNTDYLGDAPSGTVEEFACNGINDSSPVFTDNLGTLAGKTRVQNGTHVYIRCYEPDLANMTFVTSFYVIDRPDPWTGLRIASDVFWNGGSMTSARNPAVQACV